MSETTDVLRRDGQIRWLARRNRSWSAIARQVGCDDQTVRRVLTKAWKTKIGECCDCGRTFEYRSHVDQPSHYERCARCAATSAATLAQQQGKEIAIRG